MANSGSSNPTPDREAYVGWPELRVELFQIDGQGWLQLRMRNPEPGPGELFEVTGNGWTIDEAAENLLRQVQGYLRVVNGHAG